MTPDTVGRLEDVRLGALLADRGLHILDVRRGAAAGSRRLLLGARADDRVAMVVAAGHTASGQAAVDNEATVLRHAHEVLGGRLAAGLPRPLGRVSLGTARTGTLLSAVPGLVVAHGRRPGRDQDLLAAVAAWLTDVWTRSASGTRTAALGAVEVDRLLATHERTGRLGPAVDAVHRARLHVAAHAVPQVLSHGCLCPFHVTVLGERCSLDDWGLARTAGDPLQDLGRFAVAVAGPRLEEVLTGRSTLAGEVRRFVTGLLGRLDLPTRLWREVLVLAQLERAMESLEHADPSAMHQLSRALRLSGALTHTRRS